MFRDPKRQIFIIRELTDKTRARWGPETWEPEQAVKIGTWAHGDTTGTDLAELSDRGRF